MCLVVLLTKNAKICEFFDWLLAIDKNLSVIFSTSSAQHALRLISFNQVYKILAIPRLPDKRGPSIDSTQHIGPGLKRTASAAEIGGLFSYIFLS